MSAMNDIMFFLLLFFLIIATMSNANIIKILLPKSDTTSQLAKQPLTLTVTEDLKYYVNSNEVSSNMLEGALADAIKRNEDPTVVLRIAKSLTVQDLVDVMSIAAKCQLQRKDAQGDCHERDPLVQRHAINCEGDHEGEPRVPFIDLSVGPPAGS